MSIITLTTHNNIAILTLTNGENRQNPQFAQQLKQMLAKVVENQNHKALVITSNDEKCWSLGIDTDWLLPAMKAKNADEIRTFMYDMDDVFKTLLLFPMPVIAAINGHAFGNGAILACACDFRFMRGDRGFFCFPEVDLSIPFLPGMIAFVKKAIPYYRFNEMKLTGRRVSGAELAIDHVIEKASTDQENLLADAMQFAATFDKKRTIFAEHKKRLHKDIIQIIDEENKPFIDKLALMV
ncbi:enoyl-CoA hydratase/isomerase family protein [Pseudoalteromonas sp. NEC-BIFX-2020_002]|uniref:enoyl-CoA hydratase/isomerase family protein n=1 Tax=unclassified Pseudoalteromonas TaxID=194690 RepID=UPI0014614218|nr:MULTISPECIES: enoyl-CoA hydratase/isomerase family protein [unclassified Pseudoalteromonas]NMR25128.1 enoyl-CoA hydratase/isomerase family protein [Pseudoalteromonas sp. NEC-BIFX-2020_015]NNG42433.1 enoyl-CoA hydratase/isomerase family protein [Pseudoalteromonas sp. NEC-BIFX-2020_002]